MIGRMCRSKTASPQDAKRAPISEEAKVEFRLSSILTQLNLDLNLLLQAQTNLAADKGLVGPRVFH